MKRRPRLPPAGGGHPEHQSGQEIRLHHRRSRLGRLRFGQSVERGPRRARAAPGGGGLGPRPVDPYPARLGSDAAAAATRLDVFRRARGDDGRAPDRVRPRQGDRRLLVDQRHDLFARPSRRLRPLGGERTAVMVVRPRAALFQKAGDLGGRPERPPRRRWPAWHLLVDLPRPAGGGLYRSEPDRRAEMERRPQQRP